MAEEWLTDEIPQPGLHVCAIGAEGSVTAYKDACRSPAARRVEFQLALPADASSLAALVGARAANSRGHSGPLGTPFRTPGTSANALQTLWAAPGFGLRDHWLSGSYYPRSTTAPARSGCGSRHDHAPGPGAVLATHQRLI